MPQMIYCKLPIWPNPLKRAATLSCIAKYISLLFLLAFLLLQTACVSRFKKAEPHPSGVAEGVMVGSVIGGTVVTASAGPVFTPAGIIAGGIAGGAIGDYLTRHDSLQQSLKRQRVSIYRVGDNISIMLPADNVFYGKTPVVKPQFQAVLVGLADLIKRFQEKDTVRVFAFTDNQDDEKRNLSLTQAQANVVADLLWRNDIDTQLLYGQGFGSDQPIASNDNLFGQSQNRRLEISFKLLPLTT